MTRWEAAQSSPSPSTESKPEPHLPAFSPTAFPAFTHPHPTHKGLTTEQRALLPLHPGGAPRDRGGTLPGSPLSPFAPLYPGAPLSPFSPGGPLAPGGPGSPSGPAGPEIRQEEEGELGTHFPAFSPSQHMDCAIVQQYTLPHTVCPKPATHPLCTLLSHHPAPGLPRMQTVPAAHTALSPVTELKLSEAPPCTDSPCPVLQL